MAVLMMSTVWLTVYQVLQAIQTGTEAFTGTATLNVESFSVSVET